MKKQTNPFYTFNVLMLENHFSSLTQHTYVLIQTSMLNLQETQGVCVATYGDSKSFPAFFSRQSGFTSPYNISSPQEAADLIGKS